MPVRHRHRRACSWPARVGTTGMCPSRSGRRESRAGRQHPIDRGHSAVDSANRRRAMTPHAASRTTTSSSPKKRSNFMGASAARLRRAAMTMSSNVAWSSSAKRSPSSQKCQETEPTAGRPLRRLHFSGRVRGERPLARRSSLVSKEETDERVVAGELPPRSRATGSAAPVPGTLPRSP